MRIFVIRLQFGVNESPSLRNWRATYGWSKVGTPLQTTNIVLLPANQKEFKVVLFWVSGPDEDGRLVYA